MSKLCKPYGEWVSPISSAVATAKASVLQEVSVCNYESAEHAFWLELRYDEGGRTVVVSKDCSGTEPSSVDSVTWTPIDMNVRTTVHEYGGGSYFISEGVVYFCNFSDQRLYRQKSADSTPEPITPADCHWRYADGCRSTVKNKIYMVREDHSKVKTGQSKEPTNSVVCIDPDTQKQYVLACGADFYSSPRVSDDGRTLCWVEWRHPNMPWDSTEIKCVGLSDSGCEVFGEPQKVTGGQDVSVMLPSWAGDSLLYISDESGWWNLYKHHLSDNKSANLHPQKAEIGGPCWLFNRTYFATNSNRKNDIVMTYSGQLSVLTCGDNKVIDTGFSSHRYVRLSDNGKIYCIASSPVKFPCVISVDLNNNNKVEILKESQTVDISSEFFSEPSEIKYPTSDSAYSYAYFYPPKNADYEAPEGTLPPLLVKAHGGPTSQCSSELQLKIQYFTSRGFGVLDVNYRGSTGYGREYRNALRGRWGECDIEDCCAGALYLADQNLVDKNKLCIDGGSAGGYTTLACLAFKQVFKAGASHYGVADLSLLAEETHKFESRYLDLIVAPYPSQKEVYDKRSPLKNVDGFSSPVIFFQGDEDAVVPPNQAEKMYESVRNKKIPCSLVMFKGEQHGFRKSENIQVALDGELYFFSKIFHFTAPAVDYVANKIDIVNLDE